MNLHVRVVSAEPLFQEGGDEQRKIQKEEIIFKEISRFL
jgi:hypothetical protein